MKYYDCYQFCNNQGITSQFRPRFNQPMLGYQILIRRDIANTVTMVPLRINTDGGVVLG